jgi:hypothetical protein
VGTSEVILSLLFPLSLSPATTCAAEAVTMTVQPRAVLPCEPKGCDGRFIRGVFPHRSLEGGDGHLQW